MKELFRKLEENKHLTTPGKFEAHFTTNYGKRIHKVINFFRFLNISIIQITNTYRTTYCFFQMVREASI